MKDISKIIKEFENLPYKVYVHNRTKHEPTDSYFYLARQIAKCIMRAYAFNFHVEPVRTEITATQHIPVSHICYSDKIKPKWIIADKNLSQVCSTDKIKS